MFIVPVFFFALAVCVGYAPLRRAVFGHILTRRRAAIALEWLAPWAALYFLALLCGFLIGHPLTGVARTVGELADWLTGTECGSSSRPSLGVFYNTMALYVGLAGITGGACLIAAWFVRRSTFEPAVQIAVQRRVRHLETVDEV